MERSIRWRLGPPYARNAVISFSKVGSYDPEVTASSVNTVSASPHFLPSGTFKCCRSMTMIAKQAIDVWVLVCLAFVLMFSWLQSSGLSAAGGSSGPFPPRVLPSSTCTKCDVLVPGCAGLLHILQGSCPHFFLTQVCSALLKFQ